MSKAATPVDRAKQRAEQWQAQHEEWRGLPSYMHLGPDELIALAESNKRLRPEQLEALDAAWFAMFGEYLTAPAGSTAETTATEQAETEAEPPDEDVLGWKAAARLAGVSVATLRREVIAGHFPKPRRLSARRVGWPAQEAKAWRDRKDANRR